MAKPSDYLSTLEPLRNVVYKYLLSNYLTAKQISICMNYLAASPHDAYQFIVETQKHSETVFYLLQSLVRINSFCLAANQPSEIKIDMKLFLTSFSALIAGIHIGVMSIGFEN